MLLISAFAGRSVFITLMSITLLLVTCDSVVGVQISLCFRFWVLSKLLCLMLQQD